MKKIISTIAWILVVVGALNWGLVGLFELDLVGTLLGVGTIATKTVYIIVGISALVLVGLKLMEGMKK